MTSSLCRIKALTLLSAIAMTAFGAVVTPNTPRAGDQVAGSVLSISRAALVDSCGTVDIRHLGVLGSVELMVEYAGADSMFVNMDGTSRLIYISYDGIMVGHEGREGLFSEAMIPEFDALSDTTDAVSGRFYRLGQLGTSTFREYGKTSTICIPISRVITIEGDTLGHCWLERHIREGALDLNTSAKTDSLLVAATHPDSISLRVSRYIPMTDSLSRTICRDRFFAAGYRYPILEVEKQTILSYGIPIDSVYSAYTFYPSSQLELDDEQNEDIRRLLENNEDTPEWLPVKRNVPGHTGLDSQGSLNLKAFPSVTSGSLTLQIVGADEQTQLKLFSSAGVCLLSDNLSCEVAGSSFGIDISQFATGPYILLVQSDGESATVRIYLR